MHFIIFGHMGILGVWVGIYDPPTQSTHFLPISLFINYLSITASTQTPHRALPKTGRFAKNLPFANRSCACGRICDRNSTKREPQPMSEIQLTAKQEKFCLEYIAGGSASDAYRAAYDVEGMKSETIHREAHEVLNNHKVSARLKELNASAVSSAVMTRQEALERLSNVARTDLADLVEFGTYEVGTEDGQPVIQATWKIKDSVLQDKNKMALISELSAGRDGIKVKTHSPLQAIQQLAKMQGWEAASKHEITGKDGNAIVSINTTMTPQEAAEAYASTVNDN